MKSLLLNALLRFPLLSLMACDNESGDIVIYSSDNFGENWSNVSHSGESGKDYAARDPGLYVQSGRGAMYAATNDDVFIYRP